jgi:secreted trypsin-like serine protease
MPAGDPAEIPMRKVLGFVLVGFMAACSGASSTDDANSAADPIQGGTVDSADPAVGLVWFQGGGFCTGSLITPSVVLTAAHCVQDPIDGFYTGKGSATSNIGTTPVAGMTKHAVDKQAAHPSYNAGGGCPNTTMDLGLIHLAAPLAGVTPLKIATTAPKNGVTCQAIGYGDHTANGTDTFEQKRKGTEIIQSSAATSIQVKFGTAIADHGDSGGPLLCGTVIAGATSCHTDGNFPQHKIEFYARVDAAKDWVTQQIAAWH